MIEQKLKTPFRPNLRPKKKLFTESYFEKRGNHMDIELDLYNTSQVSYSITGADMNHLYINDIAFPGPVMITQNQVYIWEVEDASRLRAKDFAYYQFMIPRPKYVLVGTGQKKINLSREVMDFFEGFESKVDVLDSFTAASTFNFCSEDELPAVAFMFPFD